MAVVVEKMQPATHSTSYYLYFYRYLKETIGKYAYIMSIDQHSTLQHLHSHLSVIRHLLPSQGQIC